MAYIGRDTDKISNIEKLDTITFDGSSSYTLQKNSVNFTPNSANSLQVSIDGVVQAGNFTVSGSTIDFGVAIPATSTNDFIFHYGTGLITTPADGTVTTAKLADSSVSLAKLTATGTKDATTFLRGDNTFSTLPASGITMADQWRLSANLTAPSGTISSNLERVDDASFGYIGTGMTESSGIFSFPSTGIYLITLKGEAQNTSSTDNTFIYIKSTVDNSTYTTIARAVESTGGTVSNSFANITNSAFINVTDISNVKVLFEAASFSAASILNGNTTENRTVFTFIRLGDSV